ncbi:MAG: APC family permease [Alphaproteobacteria bacterium]|nr:APC family permease [Alphaproteobacteria bacterium]
MTAKRLRFVDAALYALVIGTGMRWVAVAAAVGPSALLLWCVALLTFYVPLAVATAELTGRFKGEGGIYAWARDGLSPMAGFLCGWFYWISLMPYFAGTLVFLSGLSLSAAGLDAKDPAAVLVVSSVLTGAVTVLQLAGLRYGKWLPNIGATGVWLVFAVVIGMAVVLGLRGQAATDFATSSYLPQWSFGTAILWGTIMFAYSGAEAMAFLRSEIEGGLKSIVRVLVLVGLGSLVIYVGGTVALLGVLPSSALTRLLGFPDALRLGLAHVGLAQFAAPVIGLFALSMLGGFVGWFGVGAQLPFAAGLDNFLPPAFGWRHPRTGAPVPAILLQGVVTLAIVILSQVNSTVSSAYDILVAMSIVTVAIPYLFMFATLFACAGRAHPADSWWPPGGAPTSRALALIGGVSTLIAIVCSILPNANDPHPLQSVLKIVLSSLGAFIVGLLFYVWARRRQSRRIGFAPLGEPLD